MQAKNLKYTKNQLIDSFKKKQNEKIRELIIQETGVDLFSELPQEAVNKQAEYISQDLNEGFFKNNKKGFTNKNHGTNNYRNDNNNNNNKFSNDFKRGPLNSRNQEGGDNNKFGRKNLSGQQPAQQSQKELIPVFQECGFVKDTTIEVWYYKEIEEVEGPFNSVDMDNMLFANKINYETKVAFKDPEEKYVRIKKLISLTYADKYDHLFVESKPVNNDENNSTQRRGYYKKEFSGSNDNNNTNFTRGVPRFNKQQSDNNSQQTGGISRPQFTRQTSDNKKANTIESSTNQPAKQIEQQDIPQVQQQIKEEKSTEDKKLAQAQVQQEKPKKKETTATSTTAIQHVDEQKVQQPATKKGKVVEEKEDIKKQTKEVKEKKPEVKQQVEVPVVKQPIQVPVQQEQNLEGFQTIPSKTGGKKKFDKKNATKILVTGLSEKDILEEENRKRLEEIRQRDLIQQQKFAAEQQSKTKQQEVPQKKIDYFDEEGQVEEIIGQEEYFPTLGQQAPTKKKTSQAISSNKQVKAKQQESDDEESSDKEEQIRAPVPAVKAGNKLVKNNSTSKKTTAQAVIPSKQQNEDPEWIVTDKNQKKKADKKRAQEESDDEFERQQAIINDQARQEKLRKQKEQEEKQRLLEQQQEEKRRQDFQKRQQFGTQEYHSESEEEDIDPSDEKSFPTLGGSLYTGPPKKNQAQQNKARGKANTSVQSKALYNYVKTLEDESSWDVQPKSQPKQTQQKPKANKINNEDFPSL